MVQKVGRELFNITDEEHIVLIDQKATLSGNYMKHIGFLRPDLLLVLKAYLELNKEIGRVIKIQNYNFIIARESYRNTWTEDRKIRAKSFIVKLLDDNKNIKYKTSEEYDFLNLIDTRVRVCKW